MWIKMYIKYVFLKIMHTFSLFFVYSTVYHKHGSMQIFVLQATVILHWTSPAVGRFSTLSLKINANWVSRRVTSLFSLTRLMKTGMKGYSMESLAFFLWITLRSLYHCRNDSRYPVFWAIKQTIHLFAAW